MKSAVALMLVAALGLALFMKCGLTLGSAEERPQTSPLAHNDQPKAKPSFTEDYEAAMDETERKVIVVFGAEWCPHCALLKDHLKVMNLDGYLVCLVDVDKQKDAQRKHGVRVLPTSIMFEGGKEISRQKGFDKDKLEDWVEENR